MGSGNWPSVTSFHDVSMAARAGFWKSAATAVSKVTSTGTTRRTRAGSSAAPQGLQASASLQRSTGAQSTPHSGASTMRTGWPSSAGMCCAHATSGGMGSSGRMSTSRARWLKRVHSSNRASTVSPARARLNARAMTPGAQM